MPLSIEFHPAGGIAGRLTCEHVICSDTGPKGESARGVNHTVICRGGAFEWDPHPESGFISGPLDNGYFTATFLLPASMLAH